MPPAQCTHLDLRDQVLQEAQPAGVLYALQLLADALRDGGAAAGVQRLRSPAAMCRELAVSAWMGHRLGQLRAS